MSPEKQRIAIAETCGYRKGESKPLWWACPSGQPFKACGIKDLPDYLNDLDAMHEAESTLTPQQHTQFRDELWSACAQNWRHTYSSTAAQRAEAFLRTIGKWEDDK